jgi:hypothetical protein
MSKNNPRCDVRYTKKIKCKIHMFITTVFGGHIVLPASKIFFLSNLLKILASWVDYFLNYS